MAQPVNPILQKLSSNALSFRKAKSPLGAFLTTVLSEAKGLAKHDTKEGVMPELNDEYAMRAIRTNLRQQDEFLALVKDDPSAISKKQALVDLLPPQADEESIRTEAKKFIDAQIIEDATQHPRKLIGPTMAHLTEKFGASLDKGSASKIVQSLL